MNDSLKKGFFMDRNMFSLNKKIYIIGPVGSGKTTLARKLSKKYNIKNYELDNIIWDDENSIKRSSEEINKIFNQIIGQESYIIEDVGRKIFERGIIVSNIVYYIKLSKFRLYFRVLKRWLKQKLSLEKSNYKPTIGILVKMISWLHKDLKCQNEKIQKIKDMNQNIIILNYKKIKNLV